MNRLLLGGTGALVFASLTLCAHAGGLAPTPPTITKQSGTDNKIFAGINWNWGAREGATAVIGYRWARVGTNERVHGALVDLTWAFGAASGLGEFHVKGLEGRRSAQGEIGVGYGFKGEAFLLNGGVRGPYVNLGTDYLFGKGWQPYVGIDTLGRVRRPTETATCPPGTVLNAATGNCA